MVGNGHAVDFAKNVCTIMDKCNIKRVFAQAKMMENRMFPLMIPHRRNLCQNARTQHVLQAKEIDTNWLWHLRMGHLNFDSLRMLQQKGLVHGLPQIEKSSKVCEGCLLGK